MDSRSPCHFLCPPVSETHKGGSTDLEKAGQSKHPQEPEGGKEVKGMERTRAPGEEQLYLSKVVKKQDAVCMTWSHVYKIKKKKRYRYGLQTCMHVCTHMSK